MTDYPNILLLFLFINLLGWIITEIYQSVLFKTVDHWLYHGDGANMQRCPSGLIECSLFEPRDDMSYNMNILRREIKARETKMMSLRKPKNKGMLIQTLKCMVAIKRKLSEKRLSESSDLDNSEESSLKTSEKTDDETTKLTDDEETGDEVSESQDSVTETDDIKPNNNDIKVKECDRVEELIDLAPDSTECAGESLATVEKHTKVDDELIKKVAAGEEIDVILKEKKVDTSVPSEVSSDKKESETDKEK